MGNGGDDISDEAKLEILWRTYVTAKPEGTPKGIFGIPDRVIIWLLLGAQALGMGPEVMQGLIKLLVKP
jgi:hypothetical protein